MSATDLDLLATFVREQSQDAFAALVQRHVNLVYSAALRQVGVPQLAEDVTQCVFTDLAKNAHRLKPDTILTAWLYQVTRRTAIDVVRKEAGRQSRERIAMEMLDMNANAAEWTQIAPVLDEAMEALDETDRAAVLLRYFENKSLREVGQALGTSDDTAQKRVSRAVERLREFITKRGVTVGAAALVSIIAANAVQAAPAGLAMSISSSVALTGTLAATAAGNAVAITGLQKALIATVVAAAVGTGIYANRDGPGPTQTPAPAKAATSFADLSDKDIVGPYKWTEKGKVGFMYLHEDHTFMNKEGSTFGVYRWEKLPDRLLVNWSSGVSELTTFEAPGVFSYIKKGSVVRLEKLADWEIPNVDSASILFRAGLETNKLFYSGSMGEGSLSPGEAGGQPCHHLVAEGRTNAYLCLRIGVELKMRPITNALVTVEYFDSPPSQGATNAWIWIDYDAVKDPFTRAKQSAGAPARLTGSFQWKEATFFLDAPSFRGRQMMLSDFRLGVASPNISLRSVKLQKNVAPR